MWTSWFGDRGSQRIINVKTINCLISCLNVYTNLLTNPSNSCWNISVSYEKEVPIQNDSSRTYFQSFSLLKTKFRWRSVRCLPFLEWKLCLNIIFQEYSREAVISGLVCARSTLVGLQQKKEMETEIESIESRHRDPVMLSVQPPVKMNEYINRNVF